MYVEDGRNSGRKSRCFQMGNCAIPPDRLQVALLNYAFVTRFFTYIDAARQYVKRSQPCSAALFAKFLAVFTGVPRMVRGETSDVARIAESAVFGNDGALPMIDVRRSFPTRGVPSATYNSPRAAG